MYRKNFAKFRHAVFEICAWSDVEIDRNKSQPSRSVIFSIAASMAVRIKHSLVSVCLSVCLSCCPFLPRHILKITYHGSASTRSVRWPRPCCGRSSRISPVDGVGLRQLNLEKVGDDGDTSNYIPNTEWALVQLHVQRNVHFYSCCAEPYPDITYTPKRNVT